MRRLVIILSGMIVPGVVLAGASGYLARVGPPPLRFHSNISPAARVSLPPLLMADVVESTPPPPVENPATSLPLAESPPVSVGPGDIALGSEIEPGPSAVGPEPPTTAAGESDPTISPQMLLRFFLPSTPGGLTTEAAIVAPPVFTPARPAAPASSSATYSSPRR